MDVNNIANVIGVESSRLTLLVVGERDWDLVKWLKDKIMSLSCIE